MLTMMINGNLVTTDSVDEMVSLITGLRSADIPVSAKAIANTSESIVEEPVSAPKQAKSVSKSKGKATSKAEKPRILSRIVDYSTDSEGYVTMIVTVDGVRVYNDFNRADYDACAKKHNWLNKNGSVRKDKRVHVYNELGYKVPDKFKTSK